jgi:hypothetical protein
MSDGVGRDVVQRARDAASRGDWDEAFDLVMKADADGLVSTDDLPVLAEVAYAAGHLDVTIEVWERAHAVSVESGDEVAAGGGGSSRRDAPAHRHCLDGAGARLVGPSRAATGGPR